jgi:hypothetical protein
MKGKKTNNATVLLTIFRDFRLEILIGGGDVVVAVLLHILRLAGDVLFVHNALPVVRENVLVEDDKVLDELVDEVLELDLVPVCGDRDQCGSEADGQVVGVHHVLVAATELQVLSGY